MIRFGALFPSSKMATLSNRGWAGGVQSLLTRKSPWDSVPIHSVPSRSSTIALTVLAGKPPGWPEIGMGVMARLSGSRSVSPAVRAAIHSVPCRSGTIRSI